LGAAFFLGKAGFISGDIEFINYGNAQLKTNDFIVSADNRSISNLYKSTKNIRVGGEFRYDMFRFRAGFSHQGDPFASKNIDRSMSRVSGGVGYRVRDYYVDLAVSQTKSKDGYVPYTMNDGSEPVTDVSTSSTNVAVTVGFKF
jgi:hypothetical protein